MSKTFCNILILLAIVGFALSMVVQDVSGFFLALVSGVLYGVGTGIGSPYSHINLWKKLAVWAVVMIIIAVIL